ncbi:MAG: hypothetical protein ACTSWG_10395 [Candidatus Helarchaeota archaeon]
MAWVPTFKLYQSDGITLQYTIENVIDTNWPNENPSQIELSNLRSQGAIIIPGGDKAWDLIIQAVLQADNYTDLTTARFSLQSSIDLNTQYILKIDKSNSTTDDINVMRLQPITWGRTNTRTFQFFTLIFRAKSWA